MDQRGLLDQMRVFQHFAENLVHQMESGVIPTEILPSWQIHLTLHGSLGDRSFLDEVTRVENVLVKTKHIAKGSKRDRPTL